MDDIYVYIDTIRVYMETLVLIYECYACRYCHRQVDMDLDLHIYGRDT